MMEKKHGDVHAFSKNTSDFGEAIMKDSKLEIDKTGSQTSYTGSYTVHVSGRKKKLKHKACDLGGRIGLTEQIDPNTGWNHRFFRTFSSKFVPD